MVCFIFLSYYFLFQLLHQSILSFSIFVGTRQEELLITLHSVPLPLSRS